MMLEGPRLFASLAGAFPFNVKTTFDFTLGYAVFSAGVMMLTYGLSRLVLDGRTSRAISTAAENPYRAPAELDEAAKKATIAWRLEDGFLRDGVEGLRVALLMAAMHDGYILQKADPTLEHAVGMGLFEKTSEAPKDDAIRAFLEELPASMRGAELFQASERCARAMSADVQARLARAGLAPSRAAQRQAAGLVVFGLGATALAGPLWTVIVGFGRPGGVEVAGLPVLISLMVTAAAVLLAQRCRRANCTHTGEARARAAPRP